MKGYFTVGFASSFCWENYAQEYTFLYVNCIMSCFPLRESKISLLQD